MGRKNRRREDESRPLGPAYASRTVEVHPDGDWIVQRISGAGATKSYRCPGCDHEIAPGTPHVVAYRDDDPKGAEYRRHWHSPCWAARDRRAPRTARGR
jgi:hypothetical protein